MLVEKEHLSKKITFNQNVWRMNEKVVFVLYVLPTIRFVVDHIYRTPYDTREKTLSRATNTRGSLTCFVRLS